jgi:hypothetical protein
MNDAVFLFVPVCPPAEAPPLTGWLLAQGWPSDVASASSVAVWLQGHDVCCPVDFYGLGQISDLTGAELLDAEFLRFLQGLVQV